MIITQIRAFNRLWPETLLIFLFLLLSSCDKDEIITDYFSPVIEAEVPKELSLGQSINILIKHTAYNGCGQYSRNETEQNGNQIEIVLFAKSSPNKGICPDNLKTIETYYKFSPNKHGSYIFKFRQVNGYLVDTLVVK